MRITYDNGELNLSMTHEEAEHVFKNKGKSVKMDISWLKVLHEDISGRVMSHWSAVEVLGCIRVTSETAISKSKS